MQIYKGVVSYRLSFALLAKRQKMSSLYKYGKYVKFLNRNIQHASD